MKFKLTFVDNFFVLLSKPKVVYTYLFIKETMHGQVTLQENHKIEINF